METLGVILGVVGGSMMVFSIPLTLEFYVNKRWPVKYLYIILFAACVVAGTGAYFVWRW